MHTVWLSRKLGHHRRWSLEEPNNARTWSVYGNASGQIARGMEEGPGNGDTETCSLLGASADVVPWYMDGHWAFLSFL